LRPHIAWVDRPPSAWRRNSKICSSVNLLYFMAVIVPVVDGLH